MKRSCPYCNSRNTRLMYYMPNEERYCCNDCLKNWNSLTILKIQKQTLLKKVTDIKKRELENDLYR